MDVYLLVLLILLVRWSASLQNTSTSCEGTYFRCTAENQPWRHDGVCVDGECLVPDTYALRLLLKVRYSGLTENEDMAGFHIKGAGPGLSWNIPLYMNKSLQEEDIWSTALDYFVDSNGLPCLNSTFCLQNQVHLEFRVYYNDMSGKEHHMLGPNFFIVLPISHSLQGALQSHVPEFMFFPWFLSTTITSHSISFISRSLTTSGYKLLLDSSVLLPASFHENANKKYPLLLVMYSGSELRHLLRHLSVYEASVEEVVMVLFEYEMDSSAELLPFNISYEARCKYFGQDCSNCLRCWDPLRVGTCDKSEFRNELRAVDCSVVAKYIGKSLAVISSIETELVVEVQRVTQNRVLVDFPRERLSIVGFGDGALTAFHAAISRPSVFQNVACISPKFFLPADSKLNMYYRMQDILWHEATKLDANPGKQLLHMTQKFYFDRGELDDKYYPHGDTIRGVEGVVNILKTHFNLEENKNIFRMEIGGASLDYLYKNPPDMFSRLRLPLMLFFRVAGGASKQFTRVIPIPDTSYAERYSLMVQMAPESSFDADALFAIGDPSYQTLFGVPVEDTNSSVSDTCKEPTGDVPWEIFVTIIGRQALDCAY